MVLRICILTKFLIVYNKALALFNFVYNKALALFNFIAMP